MALLARAPRAARILTRRPSILLHVHRDGLDALAGQDRAFATELVQQTRTRMMQNLLSTSPLLQAISPDERGPLMRRLQLRSFEAGASLIVQGEPVPGLHLIASGQVRIVHHDAEQELHLAKLGPGQSVGEIGLVLRRSAGAEVVADYPTVTLYMGKETLMGLIEEAPRLLAELYALAVGRDEETSRAVSEEAASVTELIPV
jgi:CRP-like cAMP-binding protein